MRGKQKVLRDDEKVSLMTGSTLMLRVILGAAVQNHSPHGDLVKWDELFDLLEV